jgi:hypothetical protein
MRNENGSFFDFSTDLLRDRDREPLARPPDNWGGRAAVDWLKKLASGERFDASTNGLVETARVLDRLYEKSRLMGVKAGNGSKTLSLCLNE